MRLISNLFLVLSIFLSLILRADQLYAQTLPMPNVVIAPCYGSIGLTAPVEVDPVPGADGYIWDAQPTTGILVNGMASPVTTQLPYADLTFTSSSPVWKVCVSAFSTCCTSPWNCFFIYNSVPIAFMPTNYTSVAPGAIVDFGIYYICLPLLNQHSLNWYVTGDILLSNGTQTITTSQDTTEIPLTFNSNFNGGTLCVYTINMLGLSSDTICMNIYSTTSVYEDDNPENIVYYSQANNEIIISFVVKYTETVQFTLYDLQGRQIIQTNIRDFHNETRLKLFDSISSGTYLAEITYKNTSSRKKILISR